MKQQKPAAKEIPNRSTHNYFPSCHRNPEAEYRKPLSTLYCEVRPVEHCYHIVADEEYPMCCYCHKVYGLPNKSATLHHGFFQCISEIIQSRLRKNISGPVNGFVVRLLAERDTGYVRAIEGTDPRSGIRRLYARPGDRDKFAGLLNEYGILEGNMEAVKNGKIPRKYRAEALEEIENQLSYLPKKRIEKTETEKRNLYTESVAKQFAALKGSQKAKPLKPAAKSGKGKAKTK